MRAGLAIALVFVAACTTVKLEERDAFDRKRTVDLEALRARGVDVVESRVESTDGVVLDVRHFHRDDARGTVLHYGGNGFLMVTAHEVLEALLALGVDVVMFDYRGYGYSTGDPTVAGLKDDALRVHTYVTEELGVPPERLVLHGHSMGTFVATWVADQRPAAGLVLESPVTDVEDLTDRMTPWIAAPFVSFEIDPKLAREKNGPRVERIDVPILFVVGEADNITPKAMAEDLHARARAGSRLVVVPERGHNDLPPTPQYREAYRALLDRALPRI